MNIEDMRAWVAAYESGSLLRASLKLNLTQPAVTRRIQRLEESLDVVLLNRDSKPARPTAVGRKVYRDCLRIVRDADSLQRRARDHDAVSGDLRVGVSFGVMESVLGPSTDHLHHLFPEMHLHVTGGRNIEIVPMVNQFRLDAAIIVAPTGRLPKSAHLPILLGKERVSVVANRSDGFADEIELEDLAGCRWIINPDGCSFRKQLEQALHAHNLAMEVAVETWGIPFLISLVARGMGVGLTTARSVSSSPYAETLQIVKTRKFEPVLDVYMIRTEVDDRMAPIMNALAESVRETLETD